jgi:hypothetical protein
MSRGTETVFTLNANATHSHHQQQQTTTATNNKQQTTNNKQQTSKNDTQHTPVAGTATRC